MDYSAQRRQEVVRTCKQAGIDALLITNPTNITYLTGFTGDSSFLIVGQKNFVLVSDTRFEQQIQDECPNIDTHIRGADKTTPEAAADVISKSGFKTVGLEAAHCTLEMSEFLASRCSKATFSSIQGIVETMRAVKDASELEKVRVAIRAAERAFHMFKSMLRETDTEKDMVDALESYIRRAGAKQSSFPPIVAVGERGSLPHAPPTDRQMQDGSKLLVDWGADMGYKSDLTRTFRSPFGTAPTRRNKLERVGYNFEEIYEVICKAQDAAVAAIRNEAAAKDVDAAARKVLASAKLRDSPELKLADYFTHGVGHGIGLDVHEAPRLRPNSTDILQTGMIVTIEPGVYIPGWGGVRVEDDFLVTKDGAIRLTTLPRDPAAIG